MESLRRKRVTWKCDASVKNEEKRREEIKGKLVVVLPAVTYGWKCVRERMEDGRTLASCTV